MLVLANRMKEYVGLNPKLVKTVLSELSRTERDNLGFALVNRLSDSELSSTDPSLLMAIKESLEAWFVASPTTDYEQVLKRIDGVLKSVSEDHTTGTSLETEELSAENSLLKENDHSKIGRLSEKYETGGRGSGTISRGTGDRGGVSYGLYQMSSNLKVVDDFIQNEGKQWAKVFKNYSSGSKEFSAAWKEIAINSNDIFSKAQHQYIYRTHYKVMSDKLEEMGLNLNNRSDTLKDVVWSTAVQHGPFNSIFQKALKGLDLDKVKDEQIIKLVYGERNRKNREGNLVYFKSNSIDVQKGVSKRFVNESKEALEKLKDEKY